MSNNFDMGTTERMNHLIAKHKAKQKPRIILYFFLFAITMAGCLSLLFSQLDELGDIRYFMMIGGFVIMACVIVGLLVGIIIWNIRRTSKIEQLRTSVNMSDEGIVCISQVIGKGGPTPPWVMVPYVDNLMLAIPELNYRYKGNFHLHKKGDVVKVKWNSADTTVCFIVEE